MEAQKIFDTGEGSSFLNGSDYETEKSSSISAEDVGDNRVGDFISWLPQEIVYKILSYLYPQELSRSVAPVCKQWHEAAKNPILWHTLDLGNLSSFHLCQIVSKCPNLRTLKLRYRDRFSVPEAMFVTDFCTQLEELDLSFSDDVNENHLELFVKKCHQLTSINLEGSKNIGRAAAHTLARAPTIHKLNVSDCRLKDDDIVHLALHLPRITAINIDDISLLSERPVMCLVLLHSTWLRSLVLDGENFTDSCLEAVSECENLNQLSISICDSLTDASLSFIQELTKLRILCLRKGSNFSAAGIRDLFNSPNLSLLHHLDLSECTGIDDDAVMSFVKCCGSNLRELHLRWCWNITNKGLEYIVENCKNLWILDLEGQSLTGRNWLYEIQEKLPNLKQYHMMMDEPITMSVKRHTGLMVVDFFEQVYLM